MQADEQTAALTQRSVGLLLDDAEEEEAAAAAMSPLSGLDATELRRLAELDAELAELNLQERAACAQPEAPHHLPHRQSAHATSVAKAAAGRAAFLFMCSNATFEECVRRSLLGESREKLGQVP